MSGRLLPHGSLPRTCTSLTTIRRRKALTTPSRRFARGHRRPSTPALEAPTQETGTLPRIPDRERRTAPLTMPRLTPGAISRSRTAPDVVLLALDRELMHIGRSPASEIVLDDASVSRRHALITRRGERTVILDDRSRNGVHVNGVRVSEADLHDGDIDRLRARDVALRRTRRSRLEPPPDGGFRTAPSACSHKMRGDAAGRITRGSSSSRCCWRGWRSRSRRRSSPPPCPRSSASTARTPPRRRGS